MHTVSCRFSLCAVELPASCAGAAVRAPASQAREGDTRGRRVGHRSRGVMGHKRHALISTTPPLAPFPRLMLLVGIGVGPCVAAACGGETRHPLATLP